MRDAVADATLGFVECPVAVSGVVGFSNGSGGIRTRSISRSEREWSACCLPSREVELRREAEAVGLEPTNGAGRHLFSKQAPHPAGWLPTQVPGGGIEPPTSTFRASRYCQQQLPRSSGRRIRTSTGLLQRQVAYRLADSRECHAGIERNTPAWQAGAWSPRSMAPHRRPGCQRAGASVARRGVEPLSPS
jgi:hypothetical protein